MESNEILSKVQIVEIELLNEVVRICKKHDIKYYIMYGTLIGAVRHKGFIPWDDDIDVMMFRSDYEKFRRICSEELDDKYFFQDFSTDQHYADGNLHIRKKDTVYITNDTEHYNYVCNGIWLDIWPLDNLYDNEITSGKLRMRTIKLLTKIANKAALVDCKGMSFRKKVLFYSSRLVPLKLVITIREKLSQICKNDNSKYVINFNSPYAFEREKALREDYDSGCVLKFENGAYSAPKNWDNILTQIYGDYMKLPPKDSQRIYHQPKIIEI